VNVPKQRRKPDKASAPEIKRKPLKVSVPFGRRKPQELSVIKKEDVKWTRT
jgi:hypothetical protein